MSGDLLASLGLELPLGRIRVDLSPAELIELAVQHGEGNLTSTGSLDIITGAYTGRSPNDRFIVDTPNVHDQIAWGDVNRPFAPQDYELIKQKVLEYLAERDTYAIRGLAGADRRFTEGDDDGLALIIHDIERRVSAAIQPGYAAVRRVFDATPGIAKLKGRARSV